MNLKSKFRFDSSLVWFLSISSIFTLNLITKVLRYDDLCSAEKRQNYLEIRKNVDLAVAEISNPRIQGMLTI